MAFFLNEGGLYVATVKFDYATGKHISWQDNAYATVESILISRNSSFKCFFNKSCITEGEKTTYILNQKKSEKLGFTKQGDLIYILEKKHSSREPVEVVYLDIVSNTSCKVGSTIFLNKTDLTLAPNSFKIKIDT